MIRFLLPIGLFLSACGAAQTAAPELGTSSATGTMVVGNKGEATVSFIDLASGEERARLETGDQPHEVAISPDGARAAVVSYGGTTIDIFDVASAARTETIDLSPNARPHGIVWTDDNRLIATTQGSGTLTVVDLSDNDVEAIETGQDVSHMVVVSPDLSRAYVSNIGSGTATVIDLENGRKLRDLPVGAAAEGIALTPDGSELWVADRDGMKVTVFDTETFEIIAEIGVGVGPIRIAISPDGSRGFTSNYGDGTVTEIRGSDHRVTRVLSISDSIEAAQVTILFSEDGERLYVAETGTDTVAELDVASGEVLRRIDVGRQGDGLGISPVVIETD